MRLCLLHVLLIAALGIGCTQASGEEITITSSKNVKKAVFSAEIADTDAERAQGLMGRTDLEENEGMLFVFKGEDVRHFWMKDTPLSLDMIFMNADGDIVSITENAEPNSRKPISSLIPAQYTLEIRGGMAEKHDIHVGDKVSSETISHSTQ